MSELPPLPDDVAGLLEKARTGAPPPPPGAEVAVLAKVTATVAGGTTLATLGVAKVVAGVVAIAVVGTGIAVATVKGRAGLEGERRGPRAAAAAPRAVDPARSEPPGAPPAAGAPRVVPGALAAGPGAVEARAAPRPARPPPSGAAAPVGVGAGAGAAEARAGAATARGVPGAAEEELIEAARADLATGDADAALAKLEEHAQRFADGRLTEERRALTVLAFARRGDAERAAAAARAFERDYPASLFLATVRAAVDTGGAP